jgi:hypothetical protein
LLQSVGGLGMGLVRVFDLLFIGAGAVATGAVVARHATVRAGMWTAVVLVLNHYLTDFWTTAQPDAWIAVLSAFGMALLLRPDIDRRTGLAVLAALLLGMGLTQKPTYGVLLPLPALAVLLLPSRPIGARVGLAAGLTAAALVPAAVMVAWFAAHDSIPQLVEGYLTFNLELARQLVGGVGRGVVYTSLHALRNPLVLVMPAAVVGTAWLWGRDRRATLLLLLWIGGALLGIGVQRRWFIYHWHNLWWAVAPLAGIGFARVLRRDTGEAGGAGRVLALTSLALLCFWLTFPLQQKVREWSQLMAGQFATRDQWLRVFLMSESEIVADDLALSDWLRAHTAPEDRVFVWDSPLANALSHRHAPSRVAFFVPITLADRNQRQPIPPGPVQQRMRAEFMAALDRDTRYFAVTRDALEGREPDLRKNLPVLYDELSRKLRLEWSLVDTARGYRIYARRGADGSLPAPPGGH